MNLRRFNHPADNARATYRAGDSVETNAAPTSGVAAGCTGAGCAGTGFSLRCGGEQWQSWAS
jgi:hypothetical protein